MQRAFIRAGLGLSTMGAGAILFWPATVPPFDPEKALAFVAALAVWLFAEFYSENTKEVSPDSTRAKPKLDDHDLALGNRIANIAHDDFVRFLLEHDFGGSFFDKDTKPLYQLDDMLRNVSSSFNDEMLENKLSVIKVIANKLSKTIAYGAAPKGVKANLFTMIPTNEPDGMWSKATQAKVDAANQTATELATAISELLASLRQSGLVLGKTSTVAA